MGYAGYFSTTARLKEKPTELQAALAAVPSADTLAILEKLIYNAAVCPGEAKYRRVKLSNPKIAAAIGDVPEARAAMALMKWELVEEGGEAFLELPAGKNVTMAQVRDIQEAARELAKREKDLKRSASAASLPGSADQARLREQIDADRRERAAAAGTAAAQS